MSFLNALRKVDRRHSFVCHDYLMHTHNDSPKSLFYSEEPGEGFMGRTLHRCPRCSSTNTRCFQQLKEKGSEQALFGLERIPRAHPRSLFETKSPQNISAG